MKRLLAEHERRCAIRERGQRVPAERLRDMRLRRGLEHLLATIRQDPDAAAGLLGSDLGTAA